MHTLMAAIGISAVVMASSFLFSIIKYIGAGYLIYLGIKEIRKKTGTINTSIKARVNPCTAFRQAFITEVLNPKTAMFFLAFLPQFINTQNRFMTLQLMILGILFVIAGLISTTVVAISSGKIGAILKSNLKVAYWQGKIAGSIYCALGIRLALQEK